ncbi:branched-chain amino acid ABC transporter ATP-binding protein/permease [Pseudonocardia sp. NPDC049154]|uniref:branched-chain amino acid ABC transporter ATP-binding protein/permease n=1 Tax=Pseudonocardia sp. NPDC049154 TaxID=3155501 RepID=UPI0033DF693E
MTAFVRTVSTQVPRRLWIITPIVVALFALLPAMGYHGGILRQLILIAIYTLVVSGLNLSFGYAGEVVLGQVAILALGAYITAILSTNGVTDIGLALLLSLVASAILGLVTGLPGLRLSHLALGLITFFLVLLVPPVALAFSNVTGGYTGLVGLMTPTLFGSPIKGTVGLYVVSVVLAGFWIFVMRNLVLSRYGLALRVLKENPLLASSLGLSVLRLRLSAYVIGSLPAGLAGVLFAYATAYVAPASFTLTLSIAVLAASVVGGSQSIYGAVLGSALLVLGPLSAQGFERYSLVVYGAFLLLAGTVLAMGLTGAGRALFVRLRTLFSGERARHAAPTGPVDPSEAADAADAEGTPRAELMLPGEVLEVSGATRAFGEVKAITDVDFRAEPGRITALIGANGAGKTTLLNAVSGAITLDSGTVRIGDRDVTALPVATRARKGMGRSFQTPMIPSSMTVMEVAESGSLVAGPLRPIAAILRLPAFRKERRENRETARTALELVALGDRANVPASALPLSTRRLLEVVRAVAGRPRVVLLDEPAAGMDDDAIEELRALLKQLRRAGATVVLIEHNISFVLEIADDVVVMELGKVIAAGPPEQIRTDERVIASYLGTKHAAAASRADGEGGA